MRLVGGVLPALFLTFASFTWFLTISGCTPASSEKPSQQPEQSTADKQLIQQPETPRPEATSEWTAGPPVDVETTLLDSIPDAPAGMPPAPKVSSFAPAADLEGRVEKYISGLEKSIAEEDTFEYVKEKIGKDANTVIVLALALGLHDEPNKYRDRAGALIQTSAALAAAKDLDAAKKGIAAVREAADGKRKSDLKLKWGPVASLPELMIQVPLVNTKLKRYVKGDKFKSKADVTAGYTAIIAAIAQASMADLSETKNAEQVKLWHQFCIDMRDSAAALNSAIRAGDAAAGAEAMKKLTQSCNDCHAVFHPEAEVE
ncbi:MAG: hypothetical protein JW959_09060 [Pirellulales bacterium]|nr:hypothetical protein [Pirellulales bacterium]